MNKLTYGDVKAAIARAAGICVTPSSRVADYLNEATQRLMNRGRWVGTYARLQVCINDGCITWPRQVETIDSFAICQTPGVIRNEWFEFQESGPGIIKGEDGWGNLLVDRGMTPVFDNITGGVTTRKVKVYADVTEAAGAKITIQGYDENGNWIRTQVAGEWIDGEQIAINTTGTLSTKYFTGITGVQKPSTNGFVRLYEYDTVGLVNFKSLAIYEPDETRPLYRRSLIPCLDSVGACCDDDDGDCAKTQVTIIAKLRFIPVSGTDNSQWVMLGNMAALKLAVQGIVFEEKLMPDQAEIYLTKAVRELERELEVYQGDGVVNTPRIVGNDQWGGGGIPSFMFGYGGSTL